MSDFYTASSDPADNSDLTSSVVRAEWTALAAGFAKVAGYSAAANRVVHINAGATAQTTTSGFTFDGTTFTAPALAVTNNATVTGDLAVNGGDLTTTAATFTALAGATTLLNLGGTGASASTALPSTLDSTSISTGSLRTAGGLGVTKALWVGGLANIAGATTLGAALTYGGVTLSNAVTGTGNMVLSASPTLTGTVVLTGTTITGTPTWSSSQAITLSTAAQPNVTSTGILTAPSLSKIGAGAGANTLFGIGGTAALLNDQWPSTGTVVSIQSAIQSRTILELANTSGTDVAGYNVGLIVFTSTAQSATYNNMGAISVSSIAGTANKRGSQMNFGVRTDNTAGDVIQALTLLSTGVTIPGTLGVTGAVTTNGGLQTFGANDSGGAGKRLVLVPNV